jgi:tRNA(Ile)-lysidine synthase
VCSSDLRWPIVENARGEIILVPGLGCDASHYSTKPDFNVLQYSS